MAEKFDEYDKFFSDLRLQFSDTDPKLKTIDAMKSVVKSIPTDKGRKYALSKLLNDPQYGLSNSEMFPEEMRDAWDIKHQEDYTPPDIESRESKRMKEEFWNPDSPEYWNKRSNADLEKRAKDAGYADLGSYLNDVREIQNRKNREKLLEDEFGGKVGSFLVQAAYPRQTEALLRGEDFGGKEIALDLAEQGLYTMNPAERAIAASMKATKPGVKTFLGKTAGYMANPLTMEMADALALGENPNSPRSKFNFADVLLGTGINAGVGKATDRIAQQLRGTKEGIRYVEPTQSKQNIKDIKNWNKETMPKLKRWDEMSDRLWEMNAAKEEGIIDKVPEEVVARSNRALDELNEQLLKMPKKEYDKAFTKKRNVVDAKNVGLDVESLLGNKTGDIISEDPKMTKRVLKQAVRAPMVGPFIGDAVDWYYNRDKEMTEKEKLNELLGYGLDDWR